MEANVVVRRKTVASGNGKDKNSRRNSLQVSRRLSAISTVSNFTSSSLSRTDSEKNADGVPGESLTFCPMVTEFL